MVRESCPTHPGFVQASNQKNPQGASHPIRCPPARAMAACPHHACLHDPSRLRDACPLSTSYPHALSVPAPLVPRRHRPAWLPARDALQLRDPATPRTCHPVPPCDPDSAPTVLALRSRRAARMACHLSPPTPADALSPSPPPHATQKATSQTLNYQGRRPAFATA